ncbi:PCC domain-containing protein [Achromobacter insuavis]|uniref:PCC domain-containing protein n=1 Tax=Achromobacter insuavis TaxID=1287735 RepID=UPI001FD77BA7|nr:DUF296 domain-containing protein [Achromobacter insuavis]
MRIWCRGWRSCAWRKVPECVCAGALGSLVDACLYARGGEVRQVEGPAVEIVSLAGEVRAQVDGSVVASLSGVVADPAGRVHGGCLCRGLIRFV